MTGYATPTVFRRPDPGGRCWESVLPPPPTMFGFHLVEPRIGDMKAVASRSRRCSGEPDRDATASIVRPSVGPIARIGLPESPDLGTRLLSPCFLYTKYIVSVDSATPRTERDMPGPPTTRDKSDRFRVHLEPPDAIHATRRPVGIFPRRHTDRPTVFPKGVVIRCVSTTLTSRLVTRPQSGRRVVHRASGGPLRGR